MESTQFQVTPEQAKDDNFLRERIAKELGMYSDTFNFRWKRRSIDARKRQIKVNCTFEVFQLDEEIPVAANFGPKDVHEAKSIAIIGAGPAGLFAGLRALEVGLKPVIFERGKDVRSRRRDLAILNKEGISDNQTIADFLISRVDNIIRHQITSLK